jgi:HAMP domain-containing protein
MLPFPPVIAWTLAAIGVVALTKVLAREWQRVNAQLDANERAAAAVAAKDLPTLRRDPATGEYRLQA